MVLSSPVTSGMAVLGFYVLARLMGQLLGIVHSPAFHFPGVDILNGLMQTVSVFVPRLDLMTQTSWVIYGADTVSDFAFILLQTAAFLALVLSATLIDLARRQF